MWVDEFRDLGLEQNLDRTWEDALCYFGEGKEVRIGRQYGRVCRRRLRTHLLQRCQQNGVQFLAGLMHELETEQSSETATATIRLADGQVIRSRCVSAPALHLQKDIGKAHSADLMHSKWIMHYLMGDHGCVSSPACPRKCLTDHARLLHDTLCQTIQNRAC